VVPPGSGGPGSPSTETPIASVEAISRPAAFTADRTAYHDGYDGYLDTLEGPRADDAALAELASRLRLIRF
jgi:hypothetical protein